MKIINNRYKILIKLLVYVDKNYNRLKKTLINQITYFKIVTKLIVLMKDFNKKLKIKMYLILYFN
jgi:hypothetical protein